MGRGMKRGILRDAARVVAAFGAFMNGLERGRQSGQDAQVGKDVAQVAEDFTPRETPAASGEEALAAATQAKQSALSTAPDDAAQQRVEQDFAPTLSALEAGRSTPASVVRSIGAGSAFQQREAPFTTDEVSGARSMAMADVYQRAGRMEDASRVMRTEAQRRALSDDTALRAALAPPAGSLPTTGGSAAVTAAGEHPTAGSGSARGERDPLDFYLKETAPKAVQTLMQQGHVEEAKRYSDFIESRAGIEYARAYTHGLRRFAIGDHGGALQHFEKLYNDDLYPDGRKVKLSPLDGDQMQIDQVDATGNVLSSKTGSVADLAEQAALGLNPLQAVKFMADQSAKRKTEAATLERQTRLEELRQQGQDAREDRRDERLATRLAAQGRRGGLTPSQQRQNDEIEAARELVGSMDTLEVRRRSQKATNTGRENPDFDPAIARAANLAGRRKIGGDDYFDGRRAPSKPTADVADVAGRFGADPAMKSHRLGGLKPQGREVFDPSGKLIGYYR